jgi:hypothetical protein
MMGALKMLKDLLASVDHHEGTEGEGVDVRTPNGWVDLKDELVAIINELEN